MDANAPILAPASTRPSDLPARPGHITPLSLSAVFMGFVGVTAVSMTLPAMRAAVPELGGTIVGLGRAIVAAVLAGTLLLIRREPIPDRRYWPGLIVVALGTAV